MYEREEGVRVGEDDPRAARVLNRCPSLAGASCETADGARKMVTVQVLHLFDLECVDVNVLETEEDEGVLHAQYW